MTTRTLTADTAGPLLVQALLRRPGRVVMRADPNCERATVTIHTADETGPAADAVRRATLETTPEGLEASVTGGDSMSGAVTLPGGRFGNVSTARGIHISGVSGGDITISGINVSGSGGGIRVSGTGGGINISGTGDDINISGSGDDINISHGISPIEITAVVPENSSLWGRTDNANIEATGRLERVDARTAGGEVVIEQADHIKAKTIDGDIRMGRTDQVTASSRTGDIDIADFGGAARTETATGDVRVHATEGGNLRVGTESGDITVTAGDPAVAQQLNVQTSTISGRVQTPQPATGAEPRRRGGSAGERGYTAGWTGPSQETDRIR